MERISRAAWGATNKMLKTKRTTSCRKLRSKCGAGLIEYGSSLSLLILGFLLILKVVQIGFSYCCCTALHGLQLQKAAEVAFVDAQNPRGAVKEGLVSTWQATGLGRFVNLSEKPNTVVTMEDRSGLAPSVRVVTTFHVPNTPLPGEIIFSINGKRLKEDNLDVANRDGERQ